MKKKEKIMQKIREAESALVYANPKQAAKLTSKIVRLKSTIFDK